MFVLALCDNLCGACWHHRFTDATTHQACPCLVATQSWATARAIALMSTLSVMLGMYKLKLYVPIRCSARLARAPLAGPDLSPARASCNPCCWAMPCVLCRTALATHVVARPLSCCSLFARLMLARKTCLASAGMVHERVRQLLACVPRRRCVH